MAIRGDNIPPANTPGSITQTADSNIDRIGNISNVSKTVSNMQKDVKQRITETQTAVDEGQQISMVQKSMTTVLDKLADTVGALSAGVKTITVDTAKATKDTIAQYGKAISEDISFNKQNTVAMALAKTTPIYGYFAAKFMETDVFKKAAERMKTSIGKAFGSLAGIFRRGGKGPGADTNIPKMQSGGFVKKGGLTELHAGEIVAPIEKILKRIDDSISTTKDLAKITEKTALHMTTDLKGYIKSSSASDKSQMNIFRSFIRTYKEVGERAFTEQPVERMARSLLAIQDILGAQIGTQKQVWDEMLANHPTLVKMKLAWKATAGALTTPYKIVRAFMRVRGFGGYRTKLSKAKNPLQATAENIATLYVDLMWRLDNMMPLIKLSAQANRDTAAKLTGNSYQRVKGIPKEKKWSINQVASAALGLVPGLAIGGAAKGAKAIGKKVGGKFGAGMKKGGDIGSSLAKWLITGGGPADDSPGTFSRAPGLIRDLFIKQKSQTLIGEAKGHGPGTGEKGITVTIKGIQEQLEDYYKNFLPVYQEYITQQKEITEWKLTDMRNEIERKNLESGVLSLEYEKAKEELPKLIEERKNKKKEKKRKNLFERAASSSISMASRLRKFLTRDRIMRWLMLAGTFISGLFSTVGAAIGGMFATGGVIMTAIMGLGPTIMTALGTSALWLPVIAALGGAGIGTAIQKWIIDPYIKRKEKEKRERQAKFDALQAKKLKVSVQEARTQPKSAADIKGLYTQHKGRVKTKLERLGMSATATQQMQGVGFYGEPELADIHAGMKQYRDSQMHEYLLYDPQGVTALRNEWDKRHFRTRNVVRGETALEYGRFREKTFLNYLRGYGDKYKLAGDVKQLGPVLAAKEKEKRRLEALKTQQIDLRKQGSVKWSSSKEERMKSFEKPGIIEAVKRKKEHYDNKILQSLMLAKGLGKNWWNKLDSKSKAIFKEAKIFYTKELGMTEAEADAQLQGIVSKMGDRYQMMTDPQTYKTFAKGVKEEYKDRLPQVMEAKKIIINATELELASGKKIGKEIGNAIKEQSKELGDIAKKTGAEGSAIVVQATNNAITTIQQSSTVQGGLDAGRRAGTAGMDYFNNIVYRLDSD
ncbi:MAG: hypothetical protein ACTSVB_08800 [Candidatus Heimdallarchaeaceae archaeon]